jgi:hypothetical protein
VFYSYRILRYCTPQLVAVRLTAWNAVNIEKLIVARVTKPFHAVYRTQRFIAMFIRSQQGQMNPVCTFTLCTNYFSDMKQSSLKERVWNGVHSALMRINGELLERKVAAPVYKTEINDRGVSAALTTRHPSIRKSWH